MEDDRDSGCFGRYNGNVDDDSNEEVNGDRNGD